MRSPLAYPLARSAETDAGGAADLQTDIMRFMAILALCLVAIFALVQSLPLAPLPQPATLAAPAEPAAQLPSRSETVPAPAPSAAPSPAPPTAPSPAETPVAEPVAPPVPAPTGFTLAFESDRALAQLVASGRVGLYAIGESRAWRMAVSNSRISFWDASTPNEFYEMDSGTVPQAVVDALRTGGADTAAVAWGVTLPASMRRELERLLGQGDGGDLRIGAGGNITLENRQ